MIYINSSTKVIIICPIHGEFEQTPNNHLSGQGCYLCGIVNRSILRTLSTEDFIQKAIEIHGYFYDYSKVIYINAKTNIIIICPIHGEFEQMPDTHLSGAGCQKCHFDRMRKDRSSNLEEFIPKAKLVHGNKNDYSKFVYKNSWTKGCITCLVNETHGDYWVTPNNHLNGKGCPKCNYSKGELALEAIFKKYNIKYEPQHKLPYHTFEYDFYLPEYNILIEFNGRQHYEPVDIFGGIETFKDQQKRDTEKRSLAHDYRIPLVEIHYKYLIQFKRKEFEQFVLNIIDKCKR